MVFFNDPVPVDEHELQAIRLALAAQARFAVLADAWRKRGIDLSLGIGIEAGYATLGRIGFEGRFDYGALGPVVNLASRLSAMRPRGRSSSVSVSSPRRSTRSRPRQSEPSTSRGSHDQSSPTRCVGPGPQRGLRPRRISRWSHASTGVAASVGRSHRTSGPPRLTTRTAVTSAIYEPPARRRARGAIRAAGA